MDNIYHSPKLIKYLFLTIFIIYPDYNQSVYNPETLSMLFKKTKLFLHDPESLTDI